MNIVFAGTPEFTLPCLEALNLSAHNLLAVYTQPDRPAGRGRSLRASAVKLWAIEHDLPVYQPINFKDQLTIDNLAALQPDVIIVIAYGLILPRSVLSIPVHGCINVHASLLPRWRGASPIQHAILTGDSHSGITIMHMDVGMDTGDILIQSKCELWPDETNASLQNKLARAAVTPLLQTLDDLANGTASAQKQDPAHVTFASKINKEDAKIQWNESAAVIDQKIRAYSCWPIAYTHAGPLTIKIHQACVVPLSSDCPPGTVISIENNGILVSTGRQSILIKRIQLPGANVISIADWLNSSRTQLHPPMIFT